MDPPETLHEIPHQENNFGELVKTDKLDAANIK